MLRPMRAAVTKELKQLRELREALLNDLSNGYESPQAQVVLDAHDKESKLCGSTSTAKNSPTKST